MTNLGSTQTHTRQAWNAAMRSVLVFLCAMAVMTVQAQEQHAPLCPAVVSLPLQPDAEEEIIDSIINTLE